jgi:hypothetical protein
MAALPLVFCGGTRGSRPNSVWAGFDRSQTLLDLALGPASGSESIESAAEFTVQLRPRMAITKPAGRISLQVMSCCSLKNIGTRLVLKNVRSAPIRHNSESECQPASAVHYCTLGRIMLFFAYGVFPSSAGHGQGSTLQQESEFRKPCVRCEIVP